MMPRRPADPEAQQRWRNFLRNHREVLAAMDFFTVPTATFRVLYVFDSAPRYPIFDNDNKYGTDVLAVIVLNERHLHRLLSEFVAYYHDDRTHLRLSKRTPSMRTTAFPVSSTASMGDTSPLHPYSGFHSGTRPGVHGAPAASASSSNFFRSTSISARSFARNGANCPAAMS